MTKTHDRNPFITLFIFTLSIHRLVGQFYGTCRSREHYSRLPSFPITLVSLRKTQWDFLYRTLSRHKCKET